MSPDSHYACLQHILLKKRYMLIIDGHDVYEIDEECIKKAQGEGRNVKFLKSSKKKSSAGKKKNTEKS